MILDQFRLDGRSAIVTGASRGLGAAMADALEQAGAHVFRSSSMHGSVIAIDGGWLAR
jgi:NAD(P)-dependent dehydrogenase (short-subunit alcohol dehydrogenase family)